MRLDLWRCGWDLVKAKEIGAFISPPAKAGGNLIEKKKNPIH
jgi:hypothetical protein